MASEPKGNSSVTVVAWAFRLYLVGRAESRAEAGSDAESIGERD